MARRMRFAAGGALAMALAACATFPDAAGAGSRKLYASLGACGLDTARDKLALSPDRSLLTMKAPQRLEDGEVRCLARTLLDRDIDLQASDPGFAQRYAAAWQRENDTVGARMARLWLRKNRKAPVPAFAPGSETLGEYVRKLERLCGAPEGSVEAAPGAVRVPWLEGEANEQVSCVYLAALASNLPSAGITIESVQD